MAAFTTLQQSTLVQLYVGILGTTPTTAALNTYATIFASTSGSDAAKYDAVAAAMVASTAGQTKYPVFATAGQIADTMLGHLGLSGSAVGADGTTLKALAEGILAYPGVTVASFGRALLNALNTNEFTGTDALSTAAAAAKTAYGVNTTTGAAGATLKTAIDTALGTTDTNAPVSLTMTSSADNLVGGAGNDTFSGTFNATVGAGDKVTGGAGTDTVSIKALNDSGSSPITIELAGVETVALQMYTGVTLDAALWDSAVSLIKASDNLTQKNLSVSNLSKAVNFQIDGPALANEYTHNVTASFLNLTGTSDASTVTLNNVSGSTVTLNQDTSTSGVLETLTVNFAQTGTGTTLTIAGSAISGTTALNLAADGDNLGLSVSVPVGNISITNPGSASTYDFTNTTATAAQVITLSDTTEVLAIAYPGNKTLAAGDGADRITFSSTASGSVNATLGGGADTLDSSLAGNYTIDGGDGNDVVHIRTSSTGSGNVTMTLGSGDDRVSTLSIGGTHSIGLGEGADSVIGGSSITSDDTIDGGGGSDYVSFTLAQTTVAPTLRSVETLDVAFNQSGVRRLDLTNSEMPSTIYSDGSAGVVFIQGLSGTTTVNWNDGAVTGSNTIRFKSNAEGSLTLTGSGANSATVTVDEVATLRLDLATAGTTTSGWSNSYIALDPDDTRTVTVNGSSGTHSIDLMASSAMNSLTINTYGSGSTQVVVTGSSTNLGIISLTSQSANINLAVTSAQAVGSLTISAGEGSVINVGGNTAGTTALDMDSADILTASVARGAAVNLGPITSGSAMSSLSITAAEGAGNVTIGGIDRDNIFSGPNLSFTVPSGSTTVSLERFSARSVVDGTLTISGSGSGTSSLRLGSAASAIGDEFYATITYSGGDLDILMGSSTDVTGGVGLTNNGTIMNISTGSGSDRLIGGDGADTINGGFGYDSISGGSGADLIIGGLGQDVLNGGMGNDVYRYTVGSGANNPYGNNGRTTASGDTVYFASAASNIDAFEFTGTTAVIGQSGAGSLVAAGTTGTLTSSLFNTGASVYVHNFDRPSAGSTTDWYSASAFNVLFGYQGSASYAAGGGQTYEPMFTTALLSAAEWNSGYGVTWTGSSGASAAVFVQGSGGGSVGWLILLEVTATGAVTLTTGNIAGVINLTGFSGGLTTGDIG